MKNMKGLAAIVLSCNFI